MSVPAAALVLCHTTILAGALLGHLSLLLSFGGPPPAPAPIASSSGPPTLGSGDSHVLHTSIIEGGKPNNGFEMPEDSEIAW